MTMNPIKEAAEAETLLARLRAFRFPSSLDHS